MMKMDILFSFSVTQKEEIEESRKLFQEFLGTDEKILKAYTHVRDKVIFTDKKIICYDVKGLTGNKKEFRFFHYSKITSFSIETVGFFDGDSDFKIWISGVGAFEIKFKKGLDIKELGVLLCDKIK